MSTNQQNPIGVIQFSTGRYAERIHYERIQRIEKEAIEAEFVEFRILNPEVATRAAVPSESSFTTDGYDRVTKVMVISPASMVTGLVRQSLEAGFYDRIQQWVDRAREGLSSSENDEKSSATARQLAREQFASAWTQTLEILDSSAANWRAIERKNSLIVKEFTQKHAAELNPTEHELNDLRRRLVAAVPWSMEPGREALESAAKTNGLLSAALRAYDDWKEAHTAIVYARGDSHEATKLAESAERERVVRVERLCAFQWPTVFHDWQFDNAVRLGAARAIEKLGAPPAAESRLRDALAAEIERQDFKQAMPWPKYKHSEDFEPRLIWPAHEETETDGMATALAHLVRYLRARFCPKNAGPALERIEKIEARGRKDLDEWKSQQTLEGIPQELSPWLRLTPVVVASYVAQVLWCDREQADFERTTASSPALVAQVHADVGLLFRPSDTQRELDLRSSGLAWVAIGSEEDAARLFGAGATLTFQRLIRYLPTVAHEMWARTQRDEADVVIEGGFAALAERIGAKSKKAAAEVRDGLMLGSSIHREWADGSEAQGLWVFHSTPAAPGRAARLIITLSAAFRPGFVHQLPKGPGRTLVPVVPLPAFIGANRLHAGQAALQWEVTRRFSEGRQEAAREGGVSITPADWKRMLERAGLPAHLLPEVLETWQKGEAPFLENVRGDLWTMANSAPFASARAWLQDQAALAGHGRKRGLVSAAKKRGRRKASK